MAYFAYSFDKGNTYVGSFGIEDDAYNAASFDAHATIDKEPFLISLFQGKELKLFYVDELVDDALEDLADQISYETVGDDLASLEEKQDLWERIRDCVNTWIEDNKIGHKYNLISWTKRYIWDEESSSYVEDLDYES